MRVDRVKTEAAKEKGCAWVWIYGALLKKHLHVLRNPAQDLLIYPLILDFVHVTALHVVTLAVINTRSE